VKKKLAFLTSRFPFPLDQGDKLRAFYQIKYLSAYYDIYLFSVCLREPTNTEFDELDQYCEKITIHVSSLYSQATGLARAILGEFPLQVGINYSKRFDDEILKQLEEFSIDILFVQLIRMAEYAKNFKGLRLLDFMDAFSISMKNRAALSSFTKKALYKIEANKVARYEEKCKVNFRGYFFITNEDAQALNLDNDINCFVRSNGIDQNKFFPIKDAKKNYHIGFIGNLGYPPNQDAVETVITKIIPLYKEKYGLPLKFLVAGARPPKKFLMYQNSDILIKGWYDDINVAYNEIAVFIAYYHSSTGQQNKILEAMSAEIPVLCNPELNKSILAINEKQIILADSLDMMVDKLKILLDNESKRKSIGKAGKVLCEERFQWKSIIHQMVIDIEEIYSSQKN
jgi:polysaccharide biosynthesis protein PslH